MQRILLSLAVLCGAATTLAAQTPPAPPTPQNPTPQTPRPQTPTPQNPTQPPTTPTTPATPTDTTRGRQDPMRSTPADTGDRMIYMALESANTGEIEAAQVALTKANSPRVKQFAQTLIDDHTKVRQEARDLQRKENGDMPNMPPDSSSGAHAAAMQQYANLTGRDFDRVFLQNQIDMHKEVIGDVRDRLIPTARSKDLKSLMQKALPSLEAHRRTAESLLKEQ